MKTSKPEWHEVEKTMNRLRLLAHEINSLHGEVRMLTDRLEEWFGLYREGRFSTGERATEWDWTWRELWDETLWNDPKDPRWREAHDFLRMTYEKGQRFPSPEVIRPHPMMEELHYKTHRRPRPRTKRQPHAN